MEVPAQVLEEALEVEVVVAVVVRLVSFDTERLCSSTPAWQITLRLPQ